MPPFPQNPEKTLEILPGRKTILSGISMPFACFPTSAVQIFNHMVDYLLQCSILNLTGE
ncbi:hypothetical protein FHW72_000753 [Ochrobactrum sp. RC6B]|nr:hypothetical protein [Ochrobactrum sp. RC6B]